MPVAGSLTLTFEDGVHLLLEVIELERREESERTQMKRHHGGHGLLRKYQTEDDLMNGGR